MTTTKLTPSLDYLDAYLDGSIKSEKTFEEVVRPVIEWLATNKHPHTKIIIQNDRAELFEGVVSFLTNDYIKD